MNTVLARPMNVRKRVPQALRARKAVGAGASEPRPADRQPEKNSFQSTLGPPGNGASSPTAGMERVIR